MDGKCLVSKILIDQPGVYDLEAHVYHSDPVRGGSLNCSGAKKLLPPSCPAKYLASKTAGQEYRVEFDMGHAAHAKVLGAGAPIAVIDAEDWKTKAAREERDEARGEGLTPLLRRDADVVDAMADALRVHPIASALFNPEQGKAEQTLIWRDEHTGIYRRAMLDWLPNSVPGQRLVVGDYKTCASAEPKAISKAMENYGYMQQAPWYLDGVKALGLHGSQEPAFVFVFQEKTPPYLVTVAQPNPDALLWGARLNAKAIDTYRRCTATGVWPGYTDDVISVGLPAWALRQHEDAYVRGDYDIDEESAAS